MGSELGILGLYGLWVIVTILVQVLTTQVWREEAPSVDAEPLVTFRVLNQAGVAVLERGRARFAALGAS